MRLLEPRQGWCRISWHESEIVDEATQTMFADAIEIPGIEPHDTYVDISPTARHLPEITKLLRRVELAPKPAIRYPFSIEKQYADRELYAHQLVGAYEAIDRLCGGILLADDMGLGKTSTALAAAESYLNHHVAWKVLIIGPAFAREVWRHELLQMGLISKPDELCTIRTRDIDNESYNPNARWTFIHYDIAWSWRSGLMYRPEYQPHVVILDEAHWIRNGRAQRSKAAALFAAQAGLRIALTGTPMENRPADLWHPLTTIAGPNSFGSPLEFRQRYCGAYYTGYGWEDGTSTNLDELQSRLETCYLRRTADDAGLLLPPLTRSRRVVDLRHVERRQHDEILSNVSIDKLVTAVLEGQFREILPILTKLNCATSYGKVSATIDLLNDTLEQERAAVVFTHLRAVAKRIAERSYAVSWLATGEQNIDERSEIVNEFQTDIEPSVLVATYGALKEGVTLHRSRIVILHDLTWVLSSLLQAERRIHRIGQNRACQSIWVLGENSFDTVLADALILKARMAEEVLGIKEGVEATAEVNLRELVEEHNFEHRVNEIVDTWMESRG